MSDQSSVPLFCSNSMSILPVQNAPSGLAVTALSIANARAKVISFRSISLDKAWRKVTVICPAPWSDSWQWFNKMWAGLDNYDAFSVGVDQLLIVTIELIPMRGDFKACFILKIEVLTLLVLVLFPSFCLSFLGVSFMMGVRSKRTIASAHAWVSTSSTIVFAKGHLRGKTVSKWR